MGKPIHQCDNAGSIRENLVPLCKPAVGGHNKGSMFISTVDNLIKEVCGIVIVVQIPNLIDAN
jgi:hypothetical protein